MQPMLSPSFAFLFAIALTMTAVVAQSMVDPATLTSCGACTAYLKPGTQPAVGNYPFIWKSPSKDDYSSGTCIYRYSPPESTTLRKDLCKDWFFTTCIQSGGSSATSYTQNCVTASASTLVVSSAGFFVTVGLAACIVML
jgi:hypothetical protein